MSARIEDVLAEHREVTGYFADVYRKYGCTCGWSSEVDTAAQYRAHVAEELAKAGFGDVAQARKDALTELQAELKYAAEGFRSSIHKDKDPRERARMNGRYGGVALALSFVERDLRELGAITPAVVAASRGETHVNEAKDCGGWS